MMLYKRGTCTAAGVILMHRSAMVTVCLLSALVASSILGFVLRPQFTHAAPLLSNSDIPEEHGDFFEGDIINKMQHSPTEPGGRNLVSNPEFLWPNKTLTYELSNDFKPMEKTWIQQALQSLQNNTCVRFIQRTTEQHYMFVHNDVGCASPVGFHRGRVDMFLSLPGCIRWGTIQHEFLHALGFWHEHTRPDRNLYVAVQWENIIKGMVINFAARSSDESQYENLPYDYGSVMHYRAVAFSRNGESPTIIPLKVGVTIGQRKKYSNIDLAKLNRLYDCGPEYYRGDEVMTVPHNATESATFTTDGLEIITPFSVPNSSENASNINSSSIEPSSVNSSSNESSFVSSSIDSSPDISSEPSHETASSVESTSDISSNVDSNETSLKEIATIKLNTSKTIEQALFKNKAIAIDKNSLVKKTELQQIKKKALHQLFEKLLRKKRQNYFPRRYNSSLDLRPPSAPIPHYWYNSPPNQSPEHRASSCPCRDHNQHNYHEQHHFDVNCNTNRQSNDHNDRQEYDGRPRYDLRNHREARRNGRNVTGVTNVTKNQSAFSNENSEFKTGKRKEMSPEIYDYLSLESLDATSNATQYGSVVQRNNDNKNQSLVRDFKFRTI